MKFLDRIEKWDKEFSRKICGQGPLNYINQYVGNNKIAEVYYLDIGSNVGTVYDDLDLLVNIEKAFLVEPSWIFMYLTGKYKSDDKVELFNLAISDVNEIGFLQQEGLKRLHAPHMNENTMNLGCAKLEKGGTEVLVRNAFDFVNEELREYKDKINVIKIYT
jgi:hypothetical protein